MSALSLHWKDAAESISYETVYYHLRLLDIYLLDQWGSSVLEGSQPEDDSRQQNEAAMEQARDSWLAEDLVSLTVCVELGGTTNDSESGEKLLLFSVLLSLNL